jgi:hypothetical protein
MKKFVIMKLLAITALILLSQLASAEISTGGRVGGVANLQYENHSSVAANGYDTYFDNASPKWNNISTQVNLTKASTNRFRDIRMVGETQNAIWGLMTPYVCSVPPIGPPSCYAGSILSSWTYATTELFKNTLPNNNDIKHHTALHEVGHSLSLMHTSSVSVMNVATELLNPTDFDKSELKSKWGN